MEQPQLPPGWRADWNEQYSRYLYTDATGQPTWELPTQQPPVQPAQPRTHAKPKRAYAAADAYYGGGSGDHAQGQAAPTGQQPQFFSTMAAPQPTPQQPMVGPAPYLDASTRGNIYQQPQAAVQQATQQLSHLSVQPSLRPTINLIQTPLNPAELALPPCEIPLAPEASFSPSPYKNASAKYQRCTINAIPTQQSVLNKSKIPFAIICTPYPSVKTPEDEVPVVKDCVIARCRRCRTYINPFVTWVESSNRWKCCMCGLANETPQMFDYNQQGPANRWERPELNHGVVDFVAPTEYMVRPPQPPVYVFLVDVSYAAIKSGMVATAARTLLESLDRLPNVDDRTKVSIIGVDTCLHFFSLTPGSEDPTMLVVGDLDDVFLPQPTNLLVSLTEARAGLESLLNRINDMFKDNHTVGSALGAGLQAAFKLISAVGGKIFVLTATLPSHGPGALKNREDPKLMGTPKESTLLQPANDFYKKFATDCSRTQVSVDMWIFGASYNDVATLSALPKYTGGQTYLYPAFDAARSEDALKFAHEFATIVTSPFLLEAVLRVRTSRGLRTSSYHGNAFVRSTDLLALSTVTPDQSYAVECQIEETLTTPFVVFQTAVLHTSSFGERRIRVVTQAIPTTTTVSEVFSSVDQVALTTLLANKAVERSLSHKLEDARDALFNKLVDILTVYKANMTSAGSGASPQLVVSENMKFLPILVLGLIKNLALRQSSHIAPDLRAYAQCLLTTLPPQTLIPYIHPTLYSLHDMPEECGTIDENGVILPPPLPLTSERLERYGLFLIEDGQNIFLWVGREAVPQLIQDVFDLPASSELHSGKATLPILDNPFSQRVNAVIGKVREMRRGPYYPHLYVVKEDGDPSLRLWALSALLEDRQEPAPSYIQFLNSVKDKVNGSS